MAQTMTAAATATRGKSLPARFAGVIFSPRATYADVAARPRVLGMLALVMAIIVAATFVFLSTDVGQHASLDNQVRQMEAFDSSELGFCRCAFDHSITRGQN